MKIIYPDNITSVAASTENPNFPVENVQTDYIKEVWKATGTMATLSLSVSSGNGIALFGCNASSVVVTVSIGLGMVWAPAGDGHIGILWAAAGSGHIGMEWDSDEYSVITKYDLDEAGLGGLWTDYDEITVQHQVAIKLTGSSVIEVGVAKVGDAKSFNDPSYGIKEGLRNYSIVKELSNGSWYDKKRDIVRTFSLQLILTRDDDFYTFMHKIYLLRGSKPLAWRISTNNTDFQWIVYAKPDGMPQGSHDYPDDSIITISLVEVI